MQMVSSGVKEIVCAVLFFFFAWDWLIVGLLQASRIHKMISAQNANANLLLYDGNFCPVSFFLAPALL